MSALGSLVVSLGLEFARFTGGLDQSEQAALAASKRIQDTMDDLKGRLATTAGAIAGGLAAAFTVNAFKQVITNSIEAGAALDDLRMQTGATVEALSALVAVGKFNDMGPEAIGAAMNKIAANMAGATEESKGAAKALDALGLDFDKFKQMRPEDQMQAVAKAMAGFEDGAGKSAVAMALYGKEGAKMLPFLGDLADLGELQAKVTTEQAAASANLDDNLQRLTTSGDAWKKELASGMIPALDLGAQALVDVISGTGGVREEVRRLAADGSIERWTKAGITGLTYVADAAQYLIRGVQALGESLGAYAAAGMSYFGGIAKAIMLALGGNFSGALDAVRAGASEAGTIVKDLGQSLILSFSEDTIGSRIRARMAEIETAGNTAEAAKPKLNFANVSDKNAKAAEKEKAAFETLLESITKRTAAYQTEVTAGEKLTEGEKLAIDVLEQLRSGKVKLTQVQSVLLGQRLEEMLLAEKAKTAMEAGAKVQKDLETARDKEAMARGAEIQKINEQAQALEDEIAVYGLGAQAIAAQTIERLEEKKAILSRESASAAVIAQIEEEIEARKRLGRAKDIKDGMDDSEKERQRAMKELDDYLDPAKASSFGDALKGAFEGAGNALAALVNSLDSYGQKEAEIAKMRANLAAQSDPAKRLQQEGALAELSAKAQINAYATMAGAAKGFFKEGSTGYKAMGALEKAYRAAELAMAVKNMAIKIGLIGGEVAATAGAQAALTATSNAGEAARMPAKITGTFAAFTSMLGPFGIPAAIAALAAIGIAASGGGGNALPATNDGTGTVFGDASAKSESIDKTIDLLEGISKFAGIENSYAAKMLESLRSIESKIGGFTNVILRAGGVEAAGAGVAVGTKTLSLQGGALDFVGKHLFKSKVTITGQGLYAGDATLGQVAAGGLDAGYYADVNKKKKLFGFTVSDKNSTNFTRDDEVSRQISLLLTDFADSVKLAAPVLGLSLDTIGARLNDFVIQIGRVDLKDLTGAEIQEKLNAVFGAAGDNIAQAAVPGLEHLQLVGEGYFETLARVASNLSSVNQMFDTLGVKLFDASIAGAEASLKMAERFGGLENMASVVGDYYEAFYTEEERMARMTAALTEELAKAGKELPASKDAYRALVKEQLDAGEGSAELAAKLLQLAPAFAQVADAAAAAAEAAAEMAATVAKELGAVQAKFLSPAENAQTQYDSIATSLRGIGVGLASPDLAGELQSATLAAIGAIAQEIWPTLQTDEARLALIRATDALADLKRGADALGSGRFDAVDGAFVALQKSVSLRRGIVQETIKTTGAVFDALRENVKSIYSEVDSTAAMQAAQGSAFIERALAAAQSIGYLPDGSELAEAIGAVRAGFEKTAYASQFEQERDRLVLAGKLSDLKSISGEQLTEAERQLRALDGILETAQSQINTLKGIDNSVLSVEEAVQRLADAIMGAKAAGVGKAGAGVGKVGEHMAQVTPDLLKGYTSSQISGSENWTFGSREAIVSAWQSGDYAAVADIVQRAGMSQAGLQNTFGLSAAELAHINSLGIVGVDPTQAVAGHDISLGGGTATNTGQGALFDSLAQQAQAALQAGNEAGIYAEAAARGLDSSDINALLGLPAGSAEDWARANGLPVLRVGTNYVEEDGLHYLHKGEAVIPQPYNPAANPGMSGSGNTARLEALVERMTTALERVQTLVSEGNRSTASLLEITDQKSEGGNADRVELMNVTELAKAIAKEMEPA